MIATRSQRKSASSIACVVRTIASPASSAFSSPSISQMARRLCGSRPVVGSSRNRTCGEWSTPRAISSRRRIPPESSRVICLRRSDRPTCVEPAVDHARQAAAEEAVHLSLDGEVLLDGQVLVGRDRLRDGPDRPPHGRLLPHDVVAADARRARGRGQQRRQHPDERRLAGAVGPEEAVRLALGDGEGDRVVGDTVAELAVSRSTSIETGRRAAAGGAGGSSRKGVASRRGSGALGPRAVNSSPLRRRRSARR